MVEVVVKVEVIPSSSSSLSRFWIRPTTFSLSFLDLNLVIDPTYMTNGSSFWTLGSSTELHPWVFIHSGLLTESHPRVFIHSGSSTESHPRGCIHSYASTGSIKIASEIKMQLVVFRMSVFCGVNSNEDKVQHVWSVFRLAYDLFDGQRNNLSLKKFLSWCVIWLKIELIRKKQPRVWKVPLLRKVLWQRLPTP